MTTSSKLLRRIMSGEIDTVFAPVNNRTVRRVGDKVRLSDGNISVTVEVQAVERVLIERSRVAKPDYALEQFLATLPPRWYCRLVWRMTVRPAEARPKYLGAAGRRQGADDQGYVTNRTLAIDHLEVVTSVAPHWPEQANRRLSKARAQALKRHRQHSNSAQARIAAIKQSAAKHGVDIARDLWLLEQRMQGYSESALHRHIDAIERKVFRAA